MTGRSKFPEHSFNSYLLSLRPANNYFFMEFFSPPLIMSREHWHNHIECNYLFDGGMEYLIGGQTCRLPVGKIVMFWGGIPHRSINVFPAKKGNDGSLFNLYIPLDHFLLWDKTAGLRSLLLTGHMLALDVPPKFSRNLIEVWRHDITERREAALESISFDIRSLINRYPNTVFHRPFPPIEKPGSNPQPVDRNTELTNRQTLVKILGYILTNLNGDISLSRIAEAVKFHENYVRRLFKDQMNITVSQFIAGLRLNYACSLLRETDMPILDVCEESGFGSLSQFYKAFGATYGTSPRSYREKNTGYRQL